MPGIVPDEGENIIGKVVHQRIHVDRDADLELGLFTNVAPGETTVLAAITEPTGGGYARKTLTDANWSQVADLSSYALQQFAAVGSDMVGSIQGYFICTKSAGGTPRLLHIEVDAAGPYTLAQNDTYDVTPQITTA